MNGDPIARRAGTQSRISGPILKHRSGPSSQLSGPIAGFLACVEDAQRLRLPSAPSPGGGLPVCTGPSSEIRIGKQKERKRGNDRRPNAFFRAQTRLAQQKLFTISKFRMVFVALIPVTNYKCTNSFQKEGSKWRLMAMHASARTAKISARRKQS